jgi:nickel/cobalt transporter (NiCoT) family protein
VLSPVDVRAPSRRLTRDDWHRVYGMAGFITLLHLLGWGTLLLLVAPEHLSVGTRTFGIGVGVTAYTLGMRHAFDVDHIAAIDNTTRKLIADGTRPLSVGFWFALGHSTVVFGLAVLLSMGLRDVANAGDFLGTVGTAVSGTFLCAVALLNVLVLRGMVRSWRAGRDGEVDEAQLERQLQQRGLANRWMGRFTRSIRKPWHSYPVGLLFGLGFDTATEIALLVLAGAGAASGLPWYAVICLPVLFAAGMTAFDTADGVAMTYAYAWADASPQRRMYYNLAITGASVGLALLVGGAELVSLL